MRVHIDSLYSGQEFYQLTAPHQATLRWERMIVFEILATVLIADFASGLFHWMEDAYGKADWPVTGSLITKPNILHHHDPRHFTRNNWFESSWLLLCIVVLILVIAWACGALTWHVWLFAVLGANANQVHKWAHRSPTENGVVISFLQRIRVLQTPRHHAGHHLDPKNSHYCVLTNLLNPILDTIRLWDSLEAVVRALFRARRRVDASLKQSTDGQSLPGGQSLALRSEVSRGFTSGGYNR